MTEPGGGVSRGGPTAAVVLAAGGAGTRLGRRVPKQYLELAGEPVLERALRPFLAHPAVRAVVIALPAPDVAAPPAWLAALAAGDARIRLVAGGAERGDSVRAGVAATPADADVVLIHDAARPLVTPDIIDRVLRAAAEGRGAVAAVPVSDTVKEVEAGRVVATPDRRRLWAAQTPQGFPRALVLDAYRRAAEQGFAATDDAALVEHYGGTVVVVEGSMQNLKVTRPEDVVVAEAILAARAQRGGATSPGGAHG